MTIISNGVKTAVILRDTEPLHPRQDWDNLGKMVCWHPRYSLGDKHRYSNAEELARHLCSEHVSDKAFYQAVQAGKFELLRLVENTDGYSIQAGNLYTTDPNQWDADAFEPYTLTRNLEMPGADEQMVREDLMSYCSASELLELCSERGSLAILPLYLLDHSGLAMNTGGFNDRWDSSQVGFIYMDKKTALEELCVPENQIRLAQWISAGDPIVFSFAPGQEVSEVMREQGYAPVQREEIVNLDHPALGAPPDHLFADSQQAELHQLYKKGNTLYYIDGLSPDHTFTVRPAATFNPIVSRVTEDTWHDRALACLESEVKAYDNYLRGDVYGFQAYEGLNEVDSCWSFYPGAGDMLDLYDEMFGSWGAELKELMGQAGYHAEDTFDIDVYFSNNDFPDLREKIREEVRDYITFEDETAQIYPFGKAAKALLANEDGILDTIVGELYEDHLIPDSDRIHAAIETRAGLSRDLQPKLRMSDLAPDRDYTADELISLLKEKKSLDKLIANAESRRSFEPPSAGQNNDRDLH